MISVVIPARDAADFLADAVASVRAQTTPDWDLVIVDDGSRDRTAALAAELAAGDDRIRLLTQSARGLSAARNAGVAATRGELLQLLDADDRLEPHKLARQARFLEQHPDVDAVFGDGDYGEGAGPGSALCAPPVGPILSELLTRNFILVDAALIRRAAFIRVGGFREASRSWLPIYGCEDWDLWLRAAALGLRLVRQPGTVVRNSWRPDRMSADALLMKRSALWVLEEAVAADHPLTRRQRALLRGQLFYRRCDYLLALTDGLAGVGAGAQAHGAPPLDEARAAMRLALPGTIEGELAAALLELDRSPAARRVVTGLLSSVARLVGRLPTLPSRIAARRRR